MAQIKISSKKIIEACKKYNAGDHIKHDPIVISIEEMAWEVKDSEYPSVSINIKEYNILSEYL